MQTFSKQEQIAIQQRKIFWELRINGPILAATGVLVLWMRNESLTGAVILLCGLTAIGLSFVLFRKRNNDNSSSPDPADHRNGPQKLD